MDQKKDMSVKSRGNSFVHAFNGLRALVKEPNALLHAIITVMVIIAGATRHLNPGKWIALFFAIGLVWVTEALNTCIERLSDYSCDSKFHPAIKTIKDIAAAAVLIAAFTSFSIGIIVFFF